MSPEIARKLVESLRPPAMDECGLTSRELSLLLQDSACDAVTKDLAGRTVDDAVVMIRGQVAGSSARSTTPPEVDVLARRDRFREHACIPIGGKRRRVGPR